MPSRHVLPSCEIALVECYFEQAGEDGCALEPRFDKSTTSIDKLSTTYRQVDKSTSRQVDNVSTSRQVSTSELTPSRVLPCASLSIVKSTSRQVDKIDNVLTSKFNDTYPNCYPTTSSMHPKLLYLFNCLSGPVAM